jgi:hypothetical protein
MTNYSKDVIDGLVAWTQELQKCDGNPDCIRQSGQELRKSLDDIFPSSAKLEFDNDKINYIFSTIFFLSNRLNKALIGLSEVDDAINNLVTDKKQEVNGDSKDKDLGEFESVLNKILSDYF